MFHVVHLTKAISYGGTANGIVNLCNGLDPSYIRTSVITLSPSGGFEQQLRQDRVTLHRLLVGNRPDRWMALRLAGLLVGLKPDILHSHGWSTLCDGLVAGKWVRIPVHVHGEHGTLEKRYLRRWVQRRLWSWADRVLAVSESLRGSMATTIGFEPAKIRVIPNGVDTVRFRPNPHARARVRAEMMVSDEDFVVGSVGRLHPIKGQSIRLCINASGLHRQSRLVGLRHEISRRPIASPDGVYVSSPRILVTGQVRNLQAPVV